VSTHRLPDTWKVASLGDVAEHSLGKMLDKAKNRGEPRPYLRNVNVQWGQFDLADLKEMRIGGHELDRYGVRPGDLLVCEGGEPGRCAVWSSNRKIYFQKALHRIRPSEAVNVHYLSYFFRHATASRLLDRLFTGTTIKHLPSVRLARVALPLPPRPEQERIVEAIESAMTDVDVAVASLNRVEQLLDVHRGAVLEAECLGRYRNHGPSEDGLPGIPEDWEWRPIAELAASEDRAITDGPFGSNLKTAHYTASGPRVVRLQNIGDGEFIDAEAHISETHFKSLRRHEARAGDVVVASLGETLPRACVIPDHLGPAIVKADCPRIRVGDDVRAEYLSAALNSPPVRRQAADLVAGIGRPRLNLGKLKQLRIPTPPLAEQDQILRRIRTSAEGRRSATRGLAWSYEAVETLRRSILHRAFTGQLVAQDSNEERASRRSALHGHNA